MREVKISRAVAVAVGVFLLLMMLTDAGNLVATKSAIDNQNRAQAQEQALQRKQGQIVERKICTDVKTMAAIQPPDGSAGANPSGAYEQAEHRAWSGLVLAVGCK